jgi:hypothetical protein
MPIPRVTAVVMCVLLAGCADPPIRPLVRASLAPGLTAEVVGLRRWSIEMIEDSLAKYVPGETLASHACIANLRFKLGFNDANIIRFEYVSIRDGDTTSHGNLILFVREPQDSARVHPIFRPIDDTVRHEEWQSFARANESDVLSFISFYKSYLGEEVASGEGRPPEWESMTRVLAREHSDSGFAKALRVLENPASIPEREVAILILSRYPERDEAWHALLMAAVEHHQYLDAEVAQDALKSMAARHPRRVDWSPVAPVIRDVLDGTALSALGAVIQALLVTGVDQQSAPALLQNGGEVLTAVLEVSATEVAKPAHDLLVRLRGEDLGKTPAVWRKWIGTLR